MNKILALLKQPRNIAILVLVLASIVFAAVFFSGRKPVKDNSAAIEILTRQLNDLQAEQREQRQADSTQWANYQQGRQADSLILRTIKKLSDEKIIHISSADNNELRRLLAE
jgi:hypothetical protein